MGPWRALLSVGAFLLVAVGAQSPEDPSLTPARQRYPGNCQRAPPGVTSDRTTGYNGFTIKISGNPDKYVPKEGYTVSIQGNKNALGGATSQKFVGFMLLVEPKDPSRGSSDVGSFQLFGDALSRFSEDCQHAVVHASNIHKSEVTVLWTAPPAGSGCVVFRASVAETRETWYMDDGELTKELCEEEQENDDEQPQVLEECCACDEAKYEMTFEGLWSRYTHPKDFPLNEWLTHFSDIIGASHASDFKMWEYGGYASEGVRIVAEQGQTKKLESELKEQSGKIRTIVKARGLWYPNVNGKTFAVFRVDSKHHVMSILSMLGPSPDWIVGVSSLELCLKNCSWITEKVMNLYPWDAGTRDGISYQSPYKPSDPPQRIRRITSSNPSNPDSPFYDPTGAPMKPVARLTVTRQRIYEKSCDESDIPPTTTDVRAECAVAEWSSFGPCSATCGTGTRTRSRNFLNRDKAFMSQCVTQLVEREACHTECTKGGVSCETTTWSEWSECSVTCGKGVRTRRRKFKHHMARKLCNLDLMEKEMCEGAVPTCSSPTETIDPNCPVTNWTEWSPCTVTCGKGYKVRTRLYLHANSAAISGCNIELMQKAPCMADNADCLPDPTDAFEICLLPKDIGPCRGYFPRWYYDASKRMCLQFVYGGCRGNKNRFEKYSECNRMCEVTISPPISSLSHTMNPATSDQPVIDCVLTRWSEWSPCSRTCGNGRRERRRMIKMNPENGGKPCPRKLVQRRKCKDNPPCPVDCVLSLWSEWKPCSKTCGSGLQERTRMIKRHPKNGGSSCSPTYERRHCSLRPCP